MQKSMRVFLLGLLACFAVPTLATDDQDWAYVTADITPLIDNDNEDNHGYKLTYNAQESTAVNQEGQPIKGPIDQYVWGIDQPVVRQTVSLKYWKDEPVIYRLTSELTAKKIQP